MNAIRIMLILILIGFQYCNVSNATGMPPASDPKWMKDKVSGCLIYDPIPPSPASSSGAPNSFRWIGECVNGKADGDGVLYFYKNDKHQTRQGIPVNTADVVFRTDYYTDENGLRMVEGIESIYVKPSDVRFELKSNLNKHIDCDKSDSYRYVQTFVNKKYALWHAAIAGNIIMSAVNFASNQCPGFNTADIDIFFEGDPTELPGYPGIFQMVHSRYHIDGHGVVEWREYNNRALQIYMDPQQQSYDKEIVLIVSQQTKNVEAYKDRQEQDARRIVQDRYNAFAKKNHVIQLVNSSELGANPFIYEGKTVAVKTRFSEMQTADRASFEGIIVSGVPGGLFTKKGTEVVLAGKVLGKIPVKTPLGGEMSLPHLQFVGVHVCTNYTCTDLVQ